MKIKVKNRKRFSGFILVSLIIICFITIHAAAKVNVNVEYKLVTIQKGDTLYGISRNYTGNMDIRKYVYKVRELNNLDSAVIYPGQIIKLPTTKN